jgi:hypothetical protein
MKRFILLSVTILALLSSMGFSCLVDNAMVSLDLVFSDCRSINPGPTTTFGGFVDIRRDSVLGDFTDKIKDARPFDVRVSTTGAFGGNVSSGVVTINGITILTYGGTWTAFNTPQSLLGRSTLIHSNPLGIAELVRVLKDPNAGTVRLASSGILTGGGVPPVPAGLGVCIQVFAQADAEAIGS